MKKTKIKLLLERAERCLEVVLSAMENTLKSRKEFQPEPEKERSRVLYFNQRRYCNAMLSEEGKASSQEEARLKKADKGAWTPEKG